MLPTDRSVLFVVKNPTDFDISRGQKMRGFIAAKQQQCRMGYTALFRYSGFIQESRCVPCVDIGQDFAVAAAIGLTLDKILRKFGPGKRGG